LELENLVGVLLVIAYIIFKEVIPLILKRNGSKNNTLEIVQLVHLTEAIKDSNGHLKKICELIKCAIKKKM